MWAVAVPSGCGKWLCLEVAVGMMCPNVAGGGKWLCLEVAVAVAYGTVVA
jgi:hypothetical protein